MINGSVTLLDDVDDNLYLDSEGRTGVFYYAIIAVNGTGISPLSNVEKFDLSIFSNDDGGGQHPHFVGSCYLPLPVDDHRIGDLKIQSLYESFHSFWAE